MGGHLALGMPQGRGSGAPGQGPLEVPLLQEALSGSLTSKSVPYLACSVPYRVPLALGSPLSNVPPLTFAGKSRTLSCLLSVPQRTQLDPRVQGVGAADTPGRRPDSVQKWGPWNGGSTHRTPLFLLAVQLQNKDRPVPSPDGQLLFLCLTLRGTEWLWHSHILLYGAAGSDSGHLLQLWAPLLPTAALHLPRGLWSIPHFLSAWTSCTAGCGTGRICQSMSSQASHSYAQPPGFQNHAATWYVCVQLLPPPACQT